MDRTVTISEADYQKIEKAYNDMQSKHAQLKQHMTRALLLLQKSKNFIDVDMSEAEEFEETIDKFVTTMKREHKI